MSPFSELESRGRPLCSDPMGRLLLAVWILGAFGCVTKTTPAPMPAPLEVKLKERFRVFSGEDLVGYLIYSEIAGQRYFRVVTPVGIWVGDIQRNGRFFKCEPFRERPRDLGMFTMHEGLELLFEARRPIRILPLEGRGEPTEAAAQNLLRQALEANGDSDR